MLQLLLPALIPSWRFFDRIGPAPRVEFAVVNSADQSDSEWSEVRPRPVRVSPGAMLGRLFWNPQWNESLYLVSCAERLLDDPSHARAIDLWMRVAHIVRAEHVGGTDSGHLLLRVRIVEVMREHGRVVSEVRFVSEAHRLDGFEGAPPR